jgi:IPT/TIG domain
VNNIAGSGFTPRTFALDGYPLAEDKNVTVAGSYSATMSFSGSADYVGILVAFKAASGVPLAPGTPSYTNISTTSLTVNWTGSSGANSYIVYRSTSANGTYSQVGTTSGTSFGDSGLTANTSYWYKVAGTNTSGTGPQSASSSVSTLSTNPAPAFVTGNVNACNATSCAVSLTNTNAGDVIVLGLFVLDSTAVSSVTDTQGNSYTPIGSQTWSSHGFVEKLYYAKNIKGGANTTTVTLAGSKYMEVHLYDYSGLDTSSPLDASAPVQTGTSTSAISGTLTTTNANDLLVAFFHSDNGVNNIAGSGFTPRTFALDGYPLAEDKNVTVAGSYSAAMNFTGNADYVAFFVAFKAASGTGGGGSPSISNLSPNSGPVGTSVVITGTNFAATQGSSTVKFNGTAGTPTNWSATSITVPVPTGATTGSVVITVGGVTSNGVTFAVTTGAAPTITNLNPTSGMVGTPVTITGTNLGATQGTSTLTFNGIAAAPSSWSATSIVAPVPTGATTGNVVVTVGGVASNGVNFTVAAAGGPVSDDFHGSTLNPMWTFFAACCGYSKMTGNDVVLVVPGVTTHDIFGVNQAVGLLQPISNVDFEVETKFDALVTQGEQVEGVLVEQDGLNYIWFGVYNDGTTPRLYAFITTNGKATIQYNNAITFHVGAKSMWIRVNRTGSTWTQSWSNDGTTFTKAAPFSAQLTATAIGPGAGDDTDPQNHPAPNFNAPIDYFFNTASPITPADGGMPAPPNMPVFNVWYGDTQNFGKLGIPQQWVNVLGNVLAPSGIASAFYTLNGGAQQFLRIGPNGTRLADTGDFNVEIDHVLLNPGINTVLISASDNLGNTTTHTVTVNWQNTGNTWPLPYSIDWSKVTNISDVAQIVDGYWAIQPDGSVRTVQTGYDRVIAIGDETWTNYQVTAEMTFNREDCFDFGSGIITGWTGHTYGDPFALNPDQPRTGHPFFGAGEYSTAGGLPSNQAIDIYANSPSFPETTLVRDTSGFKLIPGVKYIFKFAVQRNANNTSSHLSLKVWQSGTTEPANWTLQADGDASTGSFLLVPFRADVSFGKIDVIPLP